MKKIKKIFQYVKQFDRFHIADEMQKKLTKHIEIAEDVQNKNYSSVTVEDALTVTGI